MIGIIVVVFISAFDVSELLLRASHCWAEHLKGSKNKSELCLQWLLNENIMSYIIVIKR